MSLQVHAYIGRCVDELVPSSAAWWWLSSALLLMPEFIVFCFTLLWAVGLARLSSYRLLMYAVAVQLLSLVELVTAARFIEGSVIEVSCKSES